MKFYKLLGTLLFTIIFLFTGQASVHAAPSGNEAGNALLDEISLEGIEQYWGEMTEEYGEYFPELEKTSIYEFIQNQESFSLQSILVGFIKFLFYELILNGKLLGSLILLTLFSAVIQTVHHAFEQSAVSKIAYFIVYIVLIFIALSSFYSAFSYANDAISSMTSFMVALMPLLLGLMSTLGNALSVSFFHPIIILMVNLSGIFISKFILPLLFIAAILLIVSSLNEYYKVTQLANLFRNVSLWALGVFLTIFTGVISVQGTAVAVQDGIAMRTVKFITGNFIPVIGRTFTDAADTILSASVLLKNSIGLVGVILVLFFALFPAIKIAAIALIYKITAAILQPLGDGPIISTLNTISNFILYVLACLLAVSFMFILAIVIIVASSNITLMFR